MELWFKTPEDHASLSPGLAFQKYPEAAMDALVDVMYTATSTCISNLGKFSLQLQVLKIAQEYFLDPIKSTNLWKPQASHGDIFHGCCHGCYEGFIEGLFYSVGGARLLSALLFAAGRSGNAIQAIVSLPHDERRRLARYLNDNLPHLMEKWDPLKLNDDHVIRRLPLLEPQRTPEGGDWLEMRYSKRTELVWNHRYSTLKTDRRRGTVNQSTTAPRKRNNEVAKARPDIRKIRTADKNLNFIQGYYSVHPKLPSSLPPPQPQLVLEDLFRNIKIYFAHSCRNMTFNGNGGLIISNGDESQDGLNAFDSYCFTATLFIQKGLHNDFRLALSKAFALVERLLRAEHPRTLPCFLEVLIHLLQIGLPDVASFLRDFIKKMSAAVTGKGLPWSQICRLLGEIDPESCGQAMAQAWKCTTDTIDDELGQLSRLAVSVRLDYAKRVCGSTNYIEEEQLLRNLLARFEGVPQLSTPRVMLNLAHNLNRQKRYNEAEVIALNVSSILQQHGMYTSRVVEKIESLKIISRSQWERGNAMAEQNMRMAIELIVNEWGPQHPWVSEFMSVLEGWLGILGRDEEANNLQRDIKRLIGTDELC